MSRRDRDQTSVTAVFESSIPYILGACIGYSRLRPRRNRLVAMRSVKEQAAAARAAGLKRFLADTTL